MHARLWAQASIGARARLWAPACGIQRGVRQHVVGCRRGWAHARRWAPTCVAQRGGSQRVVGCRRGSAVAASDHRAAEFRLSLCALEQGRIAELYDRWGAGEYDLRNKHAYVSRAYV